MASVITFPDWYQQYYVQLSFLKLGDLKLPREIQEAIRQLSEYQKTVVLRKNWGFHREDLGEHQEDLLWS
jgi:hypothetical protein